MNATITLPESVIKRLEKITSTSRLTAASIVKQAIADRLAYEEWALAQIDAGLADDKAGRVYDKADFWVQLDKARNERKKTA